MHRNRWIALGALAVLLLAVGSVQAQIVFGQPASAGVDFTFTQWTIDDSTASTKISQIAAPVSAFVPLRENLEAMVFTSASANKLDGSSSDFDLTGLGDMRVQLNQSLMNDQVLLSLGVNLPIGKKKLDAVEESPILTALSQNYLDFPLRRFGDGLGFSFLAGGARSLGDLNVGASVAYQYNGKYEPYEGVPEYDPGDKLNFTAGADWERDRVTLGGELSLGFYTKDKLDGEEIFKQSSTVSAQLSARTGSDNLNLQAGLGFLARGRNERYTTDEKLKLYGDEVSLWAAVQLRLSQDWALSPMVQYRSIGANDEGFESSKLLALGATLSKALGGKASLRLGGRFYTGDADGGALDLTGFQATVGLATDF
jgi:hypothetical protein